MRTDRIFTRLERVFARLDREHERPAHLQVPRMSRHRMVLFGATLAFYLAIVVGVLTTSWLVRLDWQVMFFRPYEQWPQLHAFLDYYVVLGQRGPTAVMVAAWLGWRSWRQHTLRPLITLGVALLLLNITVGAVKLGLGRLGPHYATTIGSAELFAGGDIFPSGHTANAVVTWGILAYLASTVRTRRNLSVLSAVVALGVGATTVYLGTHWVSDVLLGWAAGLLILLALPWFEPLIAGAEAHVFAVRTRLRSRRGVLAPAPVAPVPARVVVVPRTVGAAEPALHEAALAGAAASGAPVPSGAPAPVTSGSAVADAVRPGPVLQGSGAAPAAAAHGPRSGHPVPRAHLIRSERSPGAPAGSRRPVHAERVARGPAPRPVTGS
ncbi:phosphatase PAP2 family protein [Streptomyces sp. NPDC093225]|uniref:phosphatase PAP2 family protein n=1 Tax=Streptomyces sp. NPDC093225 TaxID=3366034 RepID=UPI00381FE300